MQQRVILIKYKISKLFLPAGEKAEFSREGQGEDRRELKKLLKAYTNYKTDFAKEIVFDSSLKNLSKNILIVEQKLSKLVFS